MWNALRRYRFGAFSLLLSLLAGCQEPHKSFQVETTVHADGSCRRSIYQPKEGYLPLEAISLDWIAQWDTISGATAPSDKPPSGKHQAGLPLATAKYFVAAGKFSSPKDIPIHYRYMAKGDGARAVGASELVRDFKRTDFGLLVEYRWIESLSDVVTLDRFLTARDEILDLVEPIIVRGLEHRFGRDYDVSGLARYVTTEGRRFAQDLALVWYCTALERHLDEKPATITIVLPSSDLFRRHGIEVADDLNWFSEEGSAEIERAMKTFALKVIATNVKHRDGSPLSQSDSEQFLTMLIDPRDGEAAHNGAASGILGEPVDPATEAKITERIQQAMGAYPWLRIFGGGEKFEFTLRLPGRIVETNGLMNQDSSVSWTFGSGQAYPNGYEMSARSLEIDEAIQRKALGRVAITGTADAIKFIGLVGRKGRLLYVVRSTFETGDLSALRDLKAQSPDELKRLDALRSMLHIENDGKADCN